MKWTKEINQQSGDFKNSSFLCSKNNFIKLLKSGTSFLRGAIRNLGYESVSVTKDVAYQKIANLEKFRNSKILLIGAGPTTKEVDYKLEEYDYIWSCNHFYKNDKVSKTKIDFVTLGNENNLSDPELLKYLDNNSTIVCFENKYTKTEEMGKIKKMYPDRVFWAFTRYHSRIGSIPRLACIAIALGVKEIHFVGMDGYVPSAIRKKYKNSIFEPSKKPNGTIEDTSSEDQILSLYKKQYYAMWDYLLHEIGSNIIFKNLGHGYVCNLSTEVLEQKLGTDYQDYLSDPEKRK